MPPLGSGQPAAIRFWRFVTPLGDDDCWLWQGAIVCGYGTLASDDRLPSGVRRAVKAHRLSWSLANDQEIPQGMMVCHSCDVPSCVNPGHLFLGSGLDNKRDQINKRRAPHQTGNWTPHALLTPEQVEEIRPQRGQRAARLVAADYGVGQQAVYDIWQGRTWLPKRRAKASANNPRP